MTDVAYSKARRLKLTTTIFTAGSGFLTAQAAKVTLEDQATIR